MAASTPSQAVTESLIQQYTVVSRDHLTPEISLHLITPSSPLWSSKPEETPFEDPFWAFYWPGGQAVSRYILDNPEVVSGKKVLDVGSGSGACAISAAMNGAALVTANDIDSTAGVAMQLNAKLNNVDISINTSDLIGSSCECWDCVLCGDMFYDAEFARKLLPWLKALSAQGKTVVVGDPGRQALREIQSNCLECMAEYVLPEKSCLENRGFKSACVWKLNK